MKRLLLCFLYGMAFAALSNVFGIKSFWAVEALIVFNILFAVLYAYTTHE